jgi:hypothetical protein
LKIKNKKDKKMKTTNNNNFKKSIIIITIIIMLLASAFSFVKYYGTSDGNDPDIKMNFDKTFSLNSDTRALRVYSNWMTGTGVIYWTLNTELSSQYNDVWDYYMIRLVNFHVDYEHTIQVNEVRE